MTAQAALLVTVAALLILNAVGLVISAAAGWPAEFGRTGDPDNVLGEYPAHGTYLAAPPPPLVVLVVGALLTLVSNRWLGALGALALFIVGIIFIIANLGEPLRPETFDPPLAFVILWRVLFISLAAALAVVAARGFWILITGRAPVTG